MARQVGKGHVVHLTASERAGTKALEELLTQGRISTTTWFHLHSEAIVNECPSSSVTRTLHFTLKNMQRIEVKTMAWACDNHIGETKNRAEGRKWFPCHVYVQNDSTMEAFENHVGREDYLWTRQPEFDKPIPSEE